MARINVTVTTTDRTPSCKCPVCGKGMKYKPGGKNWKTGKTFNSFWSCSNYPNCRGSRPGNYNPQTAALQKSAAFSLPFTPTDEQSAIWDEMEKGDTHLIVNAFAGTGKSTTTRIGMYRVDPSLSIFYGCFGKRNVQEFEEKGFPDNATVQTFNAFGHRACIAAFGSKIKPDEHKTLNIVDSIWPLETAGVEKDFHNSVKFTLRKLVGLVKGYLADWNNASQITDICERHEVDFDGEEHKGQVMALLPKVMETGNNPQSGFGMDFDDQLYWPVVLKLPVKQFDVVCVDEAQDCNPCQHKLIAKMLGPRSRCIVIGDDYQAIFGFRGSDTDSMQNLAELLVETTNKPVKNLSLTITQRCPKSIVDYAQRYVPDIKAREDAPAGEIYGCDAVNAFPLYRPGDMVVCRVNAPLLGIAFGLIKIGTKAVVLGRDVAEQLKNLVKRMKAQTVADLLAKVQAWAIAECNKVANSRNCETICQRVNDQADCITVLAEDAESVDEIIHKITTIFADEKDGKPVGCVTLSSIHKAKGLESTRVFWYAPAITCKCKQEWQAQQENNLKYVAITRAKSVLYHVYEKGKNEGAWPTPPAIVEAQKEAQQALDKVAARRAALLVQAYADNGEGEVQEIEGGQE